MGTTMSEPCIYDKLSESIDILRQSGYRYGMSEREIEKFIKQVLETNEPRRDPPQFPILRATVKVDIILSREFYQLTPSKVNSNQLDVFAVSVSLKIPIFSAVCGGSGLSAGSGAGLHLPPEPPATRPGQCGGPQLAIAPQSHPPAVFTHRKEVQPARY